MQALPPAFVIVLKRDGSEGGRFPLYEDALVGRCVAVVRPRVPLARLR